MVIVYIGTDYIQVLYLGRAPRTKETLPDFHECRRVTRYPLVFHGLTGSQRTPGNWGVTMSWKLSYIKEISMQFNKMEALNFGIGGLVTSVRKDFKLLLKSNSCQICKVCLLKLVIIV